MTEEQAERIYELHDLITIYKNCIEKWQNAVNCSNEITILYTTKNGYICECNMPFIIPYEEVKFRHIEYLQTEFNKLIKEYNECSK